MKNNLFGNPGLKIASLVIAFVIWLVILNVSNPEITRTYSGVPVEVTNASYVESRQQLYASLDRNPTVSVTVHTNRSLTERLSSWNISATADLTQITDFTPPVYVPVNVTVPGVSQDDVTVNPRMIEIALEEIESREFVINPSTAGTTPSTGFEVGKLSVAPEKVKIKGPKSVVDKIDHVSAEVSVTGISVDQTISAKTVVYDRNGEALTDSQMSSLTIGDGSTQVRVDVTLYRVLQDVRIRAEAYGEPAQGYQIGDVTTTPESVRVVGSDEALEAFEEAGAVIEIPEASGDVDISGSFSDQDVTVDITNYLPEGISLASDTGGTVVVHVKILPYNTRSVEIETKKIEKRGLPQDHNAVFVDVKLDIRVTATDDILGNITADDISAYVDLTDAITGDVTVPVIVTLPEGCTLAEDVYATMTVTEITREETVKDNDS